MIHTYAHKQTVLLLHAVFGGLLLIGIVGSTSTPANLFQYETVSYSTDSSLSAVGGAILYDAAPVGQSSSSPEVGLESSSILSSSSKAVSDAITTSASSSSSNRSIASSVVTSTSVASSSLEATATMSVHSTNNSSSSSLSASNQIHTVEPVLVPHELVSSFAIESDSSSVESSSTIAAVTETVTKKPGATNDESFISPIRRTFGMAGTVGVIATAIGVGGIAFGSSKEILWKLLKKLFGKAQDIKDTKDNVDDTKEKFEDLFNTKK